MQLESIKSHMSKVDDARNKQLEKLKQDRQGQIKQQKEMAQAEKQKLLELKTHFTELAVEDFSKNQTKFKDDIA